MPPKRKGFMTSIPLKKMRLRKPRLAVPGIPSTLRRFAHMIASVDDERRIDNGIWVNLKAGYIDGESGCHAIHEDTLAECAGKFDFVDACQCEDCANGK